MWNPQLVNQVRDWMGQLFVWDQAEKQRIVRAATAQGYGLSDEMYARPFPGSVPSTMQLSSQSTRATPPVAAKAAGSMSTLAKVGIASALALGTGGLGLGAASLFMRPAAIPPAVNTATGFGLELVQPGK